MLLLLDIFFACLSIHISPIGNRTHPAFRIEPVFFDCFTSSTTKSLPRRIIYDYMQYRTTSFILYLYHTKYCPINHTPASRGRLVGPPKPDVRPRTPRSLPASSIGRTSLNISGHSRFKQCTGVEDSSKARALELMSKHLLRAV